LRIRRRVPCHPDYTSRQPGVASGTAAKPAALKNPHRILTDWVRYLADRNSF
jgi:hypothetical protein